MPRNQAVYGKRSRAYYNPADIFASPQHEKRQTWAPFALAEDDDEASMKATSEVVDNTATPARRRKALQEISGNAAHTPEKGGSTRDKGRVVRRKPRKSDELKKEVEVAAVPVVEKDEEDGPASTATPAMSQPEDIVTESLAAEVPVVRADSALDLLVPTEDGHTWNNHDEANYESTVQDPQERPPKDEAKTVPATREASPEPPPNPYDQHTYSLLDLTAHPISPFSDWAEAIDSHFTITKIAEASFGEVYRLSLPPSPTSPPLSHTGESVLKIIALTPPPNTLPTAPRDRARALQKAEAMSKPSDVASEVQLLQTLTSIPGFTNFRDVRVLRGRPPSPFIRAFKTYNTAQRRARKEVSIFPDPAKKSNYSASQLWAVIEMQDAGIDLERLVAQGQCRTIWSVWDVFWQVVLALAKGEEEAEFEHRDLHLGNICVRAPATSPPRDLGKKLGFTGVEATLIDYTISRCSLRNSSNTDTSGKGGATAFIDLADDPHIFSGDSAEEYQYEIYRYMRNAIYTSSPLQAPPSPCAPPPDRSWQHFHPQTNLIWLHYVLYMLLEQLTWPSSGKAPGKRAKGRGEWERSLALERVLLEVQDLLDPGVLGEGGLGRAGELVALAVGEGWLGVGDVVGEVQGEGAGEEEGELVERLGRLVVEEEQQLADGEVGAAGDQDLARNTKATRKTRKK